MENNITFILVDDDSLNNLINKKIITRTFPNANVIDFVQPLQGLDYILSNYNKILDQKSILLLDINMPEMDGWEFMEQIEKADSIVRENLRIYILSSSVYPSDIEKAESNSNIIAFIEKPLSVEFIKSLKV